MHKKISYYTQTSALLMALSFLVSTGCTDDDDDGGFDESYENQVKLTCNGTVLVDRTFTSRDACETFRDANTFMCSGIELTISC